MRRTLLVLVSTVGLLAGGASFWAGYKIKPFSAAHANTYAAKDSHDGITVAAEPYDQAQKILQVFDVDFRRANDVAVLVVISNDRDEEIRVDGNSIELTGARMDSVEATPADTVVRDVYYGKRKQRSGAPPIRIGLPGGLGGGKGVDKNFETARADFLSKEFGTKLIAPHTSAYGFVFFEGTSLVGRKVYLPTIRITRSPDPKRVGHELMFYEVDLKPAFLGHE